ncbi:MFS transporter [Sphingomonas sp. DBB INV C78]|uniref:MFS transporter n=1 Tax=Sphingomonas sp. DBB INV C78 TaxID=3349434 RepID=UPI0036D42CEA
MTFSRRSDDAILQQDGNSTGIADQASHSPNRRESVSDWLVVLSAFIGLAVSVMYVYSMGLFFAPLQAEFGWQRSEIAAGMTIVSVITVIVAPFVGIAVDQFGSRVIACFGLCLHCAAIALLATTGGSIWNWWALWGLVAIGAVLIKPTVWMTAIAGRFSARRGLAIGLAMSGIGAGSAVMPWLTSTMIDRWGWRVAYALFGGGGVLLAMPILLLFFRDSGQKERGAPLMRRPLNGVSRRDGLRSRVFHKMALASFLATFSTIAVTVHFVPILTDAGVPRETAALLAGVIGTASIAGRLGTGYLLDRVNATIVGAVGCFLPIVTALMLLNYTGTWIYGVVCAAVLGVAIGTEVDVLAYLSARYFGMRNYGMLFGTLAGMLALGSGTGAAFGGLMYDSFGSYHALLIILVPVYATTAALIATLGEPPKIFEL